MTMPIEFSTAWSLFRKLEEATEDDVEFPVPDIEEFVAAAEEEIGPDGLLEGWSLVAARLRKVVLIHAEKVGCTCGSREWLAAEQLRNVEHEEEEE